MQRKPENKNDSARSFNRQSGKTHPKNNRSAPMRGGWRL